MSNISNKNNSTFEIYISHPWIRGISFEWYARPMSWPNLPAQPESVYDGIHKYRRRWTYDILKPHETGSLWPWTLICYSNRRRWDIVNSILTRKVSCLKTQEVYRSHCILYMMCPASGGTLSWSWPVWGGAGACPGPHYGEGYPWSWPGEDTPVLVLSRGVPLPFPCQGADRGTSTLGKGPGTRDQGPVIWVSPRPVDRHRHLKTVTSHPFYAVSNESNSSWFCSAIML